MQQATLPPDPKIKAKKNPEERPREQKMTYLTGLEAFEG